MPACPVCGHENPDGARFCNACAAEIVPARTAREVRKTVSLVFADVTGSTALGEKLDPESLRRVLGRYFGAMRDAVERHGGTDEKFIGDAVMAVFGSPVLHEDDALRAVRTAAEVRERLTVLNDQLERDYGVRIVSRIGVNTGEVVAGGVLEAMFGHFDEARRLGAEARARTEEFGESMSITAHRAEKLWMVEMLAGDAVAAEREIRRGFELLERAGERAGCRRRPPSSRRRSTGRGATRKPSGSRRSARRRARATM